MTLRIDIFCRVIDNYGDIGVCWRLAQQLAVRQSVAKVRLWVDDLVSFQRIAPAVNAKTPTQLLNHVDVHHWSDNEAACFPTPADVVIEAFACELPAAYRQQLSGQELWLNLEYLSAEGWVEGFHLQASPQPESQHKYFYFPGFTPNTGGLLRESQLLAQREAWLKSTAAQHTLLQKLGLAPQQITDILQHRLRLVVFFQYESAPLATLLQALSQQAQPSLVLSPRASDVALARSLNLASVKVQQFGFLPQAEFDQLLWTSQLNFVRGEDSLIRALWAAQPMIWQPYPQSEDSHLVKLEALLQRSSLPPLFQQTMLNWSTGYRSDLVQQLSECLSMENWDKWRAEALQWQATLAQQTDLVTQLLRFSQQHVRQR